MSDSTVRMEVPFGMTPEWVLTAAISSHAKVIYGYLALIAASSRRQTPSRGVLAEVIGASIDTVDRAVAQLKEIGALISEARYVETASGAQRQTTNDWVLMQTPTRPHPCGPPTPDPGRTHAAPPAAPMRPQSIEEELPLQEQLQEPPQPPAERGERPRQRSRDAPDQPDQFARFYDAYPRKRDRGHAITAWNRALRIAAADVIVVGAQRYRDDPNLPRDQTKIPYPATWLNGRRWEDGPLERPTGSQVAQRQADVDDRRIRRRQRAAALDAQLAAEQHDTPPRAEISR